MNTHDTLKLMPEVLAALKASGQNVSLARDLEAAMEADPVQKWLEEFEERAMALYTATDDHLASLEALLTHGRNHPALQSQDREDAERYRWLRADNAYFPEENYIRGGQELDAAIDYARLIERET